MTMPQFHVENKVKEHTTIELIREQLMMSYDVTSVEVCTKCLSVNPK